MLRLRVLPNTSAHLLVDSFLPRNLNTLMEPYPTEKSQWLPSLVDPRYHPKSLCLRHFLTNSMPMLRLKLFLLTPSLKDGWDLTTVQNPLL